MTMITAKPILHRLSDLQPAADAAPLVAVWSAQLPTSRPDAATAAAQSARVSCNLWLTTFQWSGPVEKAAAIVHELVRNAVLHGTTASPHDVTLRFALTQCGALLIEVTDGLGTFPAFDAAAAYGGLGRARRHGADITWYPTANGKIVQARLPAPGAES